MAEYRVYYHLVYGRGDKQEPRGPYVIGIHATDLTELTKRIQQEYDYALEGRYKTGCWWKPISVSKVVTREEKVDISLEHFSKLKTLND